MLLQLVLLILFAEQVNDQKESLILLLVCLYFFSWSQIFVFQVPRFVEFCQKCGIAEHCSVQFLKAAVVILLFLLIIVDKTQHFGQILSECRKGLSLFILIRNICSMFS